MGTSEPAHHLRPCGVAFNVQRALDCKLGGLRIIQHNEVRDTIAQCMREAGHVAVELEPLLLPLEGEVFEYKSANKSDEARSDISAVVSGATCDRHISILRWCHLLPEAMLIWNQHSCSRMQSVQRSANT